MGSALTSLTPLTYPRGPEKTIKTMRFCRALLSQFGRKRSVNLWGGLQASQSAILLLVKTELPILDPDFNSDNEENVLPHSDVEDSEEVPKGGRVGNRGMQKDKAAKINAKKVITNDAFI